LQWSCYGLGWLSHYFRTKLRSHHLLGSLACMSITHGSLDFRMPQKPFHRHDVGALGD
jgi:hypothetical protein